MKKVSVIGGTGYTGSEIVDLVVKHPEVELTHVSSRIEKPVKYAELFPKFQVRTDVLCEAMDVDRFSADSDIVFLSVPHTISMDIAPKFLEKGKKVIDLSADYRLGADEFKKWYSKEHSDKANLDKAVYGMPELFKERIVGADLVANPGCYPTSVILALAPVIKSVLSSGGSVIVDSKSGTTGAGKKALLDFSFSEVDENFKCYKANEHQHIPEMEKVLGEVAEGKVQINFTPHLLPIKRGILSTIYVTANDLPDVDKIYEAYQAMYKDEPFVRVRDLGDMPEIKDVALTNFCDIGIVSARGVLIIVSVIDNLLKGAAGQAVQNMNIMLGLDEKTGLM
jgi:N-acetyl-gamma-glutamyl-phosphate reductase